MSQPTAAQESVLRMAVRLYLDDDAAGTPHVERAFVAGVVAGVEAQGGAWRRETTQLLWRWLLRYIEARHPELAAVVARQCP